MVLYPEMVKVEVALDTGEIIGYDAVGYLTNTVSKEPRPSGFSNPSRGKPQSWACQGRRTG